MIHICLISEQLLANLIPIYIDEPEKVAIIVTSKMQSKADLFKSILQKKGMSILEFNHAPDHEYEKIWEYAAHVAEQLAEESEPKLNITGGNKLMAMAFKEVFENARIIYLDTANQQIEHFGKATPSPMISPVPPILTIESYLEAQGATFRSATNEESLQPRNITQYLANHAGTLDSFFGSLNYLSSEALEERYHDIKLKQPIQIFREEVYSRAFKEALQQLNDAEILSWDKNQTIEFLDVPKTQYCKGGWLEEYVFFIAKELQPNEVRINVKVTWSGTAKKDAPRNEFDVIVIHNNKMLVIECKTSKNKEEKGQQIVNKLENLGNHAGGTFGTVMLVSARKRDLDTENRCKANNIKYIIDLKQLKPAIENWMNN